MGFFRFITSNGRWLTAGGLLSMSSSFGQTFFISVFAGEIMATFSLSDGQWGGIYSIGTTASAGVMMWAGTLSDRFRAKTLGTAFLLLLSIACLFMANISAAWLLPVAIFTLRFTGQGMLSHISAVALARWYSAARGKALAIAGLGFSMGEAFLPLLFVSLLAVFDWRLLWVFAAFATVLLIPPLRLLLQKERTPGALSQSDSSTGIEGRHWTRKQVVSHWLFWLMIPNIIGPGIFSTALFFQQVHLAQTKGWDHASFVAMFPIYTAVTICSMLVFGWAIDRWSCARFMPIYQVPMALAYFTFGSSDTMVLAALGFFFMGIMQGGGATLSIAFWPEVYGTKHLGSIKTLMVGLMVFGSALGPGVTGALIDMGVNFEDQMIYFAFYILATCGLTYLAIYRFVVKATA